MDNIRKEFPIFDAYPDLVYLDSAASAQKPRIVIEAMSKMLESQYANVHRGVYQLSEQATLMYEGAREKVKEFVGARSSKEIIFTKNATEAINLVAYTWALENVQEGEIIVVSETEHHSNFLPWQMVAQKRGAVLKVIPYDKEKGVLGFEFLEDLIDVYKDKVVLVAVTHISNVLGVIHPIGRIISMAHRVGAKVLVDGCQAVAHIPINVKDLDVDFYAFSGHKLYGPTGIGVLFAKRDLLEYMHPFMRGGEMVLEVQDPIFKSKENGTIWKELPWKFEAGTPPIIEVVGLGRAIEFIQSCGFEKIMAHEHDLLGLLLNELVKISGVRLLGGWGSENRIGVVSFLVDGIHPHDVAGLLDGRQICVRAGTHCAQPLLKSFGVGASVRVSLGLYNTTQDISRFITAMKQILTEMR